jgi:hypothetical protein
MPNKIFEYTASRFLGNWLIAIHMLAALIILILPIFIFIKLIFLFIILLLYLLPLRVGARNEGRFISDFLLILHFSKEERLVLFRHQLSQSDWRMLQRLLRCQEGINSRNFRCVDEINIIM